MTPENIRELIARNKLSEALDLIQSWAAKNDPSLENDAILLSSRLSSVQRNERMGIMSFDQVNLERNRITHALIDLASQIKVDAENNDPAAILNNNQQLDTQNSVKKMFISYAREDKSYVDQLEKHFSPLRRKGLLETWNDSNIQPGQSWSKSIEDNLRSSGIILFMVSVDFLSSDYIQQNERVWANEARQSRDAIIVPVITRECYWEDEDFAAYNAIPRHPETHELTPIANWKNQDQAYLTIVRSLEQIIRGVNT